jgi:heat-inducible transcriptional repressor
MTNDSNKAELNERARILLKALVEEYIQHGQPVGSKTLAKTKNIGASPATIRNIMSSLEDMGFVTSPHTSAGRVPTVKGYRFFVDSLVTFKNKGNNSLTDELKKHLDQAQSTQNLVKSVSEYLSGITQLAGIVTLPRQQALSIQQMDFLRLSDTRVLVILVTSDREVHNRIIDLHRTFSDEELKQIAAFLNSRFSGKHLSNIRTDLLHDLQKDREYMDRLMQSAVDMAENVFSDSKEEDFILAGEVNLMNFEDLSNINKLKELFDAFTKKREIIHLLDQCLSADGVQIFIGEESGYQVLGDCSVITSPYSAGGEVLGVLGVIGPTRIPYEQVIPIVDVTAKVLGAALNSKQ